MNTFLLWTSPESEPPASTPEDVGQRLRDVFASVFSEQPEVVVRAEPSAQFVFLDAPVRGFRPSVHQEDEKGWAVAIEYPLNLRGVLRSRSIAYTDDDVLLQLCRNLEQDPTPLLRDLTPPFALVWGRFGGPVFFQNDGMGQSQVFTHRRGDRFILTNRIAALKALGIQPRPVPLQWATRFTLGWFPGTTSGFEATTFVPPATRVRFDGDSVSESQHDVLADWVRPEKRSPDDCRELARSSILELIRENAPQWSEPPSVGLSGGWDSRAITAALRSLDVPISPRVRGNPDRLDVRIASQLAAIAGFRIRLKTRSGMPPTDTTSFRNSIRKALRWQAGYMTTRRHKTFLSRKDGLDFGVVNVMGQHGGFGKADFVGKIDAHNLQPHEFEPRLVDKLMGRVPPYLREDLVEGVRESILTAYRQADRYDLQGLHRLHFFFLYEYTRRWSSASLASQTGLVFAPYLNPDFIRACYAFPPELLTDRPFHRFITKTLAPEWADVPYSDRVTKEMLEAGVVPEVHVKTSKRREFAGSVAWKQRLRHKKYDYDAFWADVGAPLIDEALAAGGFWTEVFDERLAREGWRANPDPLVIAHLLDETD